MSAGKLLLAVESATAVASIALFRGESLLSELSSRAGQHHSESLLPMIDTLLEGAGVRVGELDAIAVSIGPGAFTSLRIGIATVKGLAFGPDAIPVAPVSTLAGLALVGLENNVDLAPGACVAAALDARRGELYAAAWEADALRATVGSGASDVVVEPLLPEGVHTPAELAASLPDAALVVGEGGPLFAEILGRVSGGRLRLEAPPGSVPTASAVGRLGLRLLARGGGISAADLVPRYVRRAEAEVTRTRLRFE